MPREEQANAGEIEITRFRLEDLDDVMKIEGQSFTAPWSRQSYLDMAPLDTVYFYVVRKDDKLIGYMLFQRWAEEMELHTIAVDPVLRHSGVATKMMEFLLDEAKTNGVHFIYLQVRPSNEAARKLYEKFGFKVIGVRHGYYRDNREDALVMKKEVLS